MATELTASIEQISPQDLFSDGFELQDQSIIPNQEITGVFNPESNIVELFIYDAQSTLIYGDSEFKGYRIESNSDTTGINNTDALELTPEADALDAGFDVGQVYNIYNFINYELNTSPTDTYYISEISSDRTELRLKSNFITNQDIESSVAELKLKLESADFFDEFYLNFGENGYAICVNIQLDKSDTQSYLLLKIIFKVLI
jgi:hypothetical protein